MDEIRRKLMELLGKAPKKVLIGELSDTEKVQMLELQTFEDHIQKLIAEHKAMHTSFWSSLEVRLKMFDVPLTIDRTTGEIFQEIEEE